MTITVDIAAARAFCQGATDGPWHVGKPYEREGASVRLVDVLTEPDGCDLAAGCFRGDARFIAAARTLLPLALDEIEQLRKELHLNRAALAHAVGNVAEIERLRATLALPCVEWALGMRSAGVDVVAQDGRQLATLKQAHEAVRTTLAAADATVAGLAAAGDKLSAEHERWRPVVEAAKAWRTHSYGEPANDLCVAVDVLLAVEAKAPPPCLLCGTVGDLTLPCPGCGAP